MAATYFSPTTFTCVVSAHAPGCVSRYGKLTVKGTGLRGTNPLPATTCTFTLTFQGQTTAAITWNAVVATVQTERKALGTVVM